MKARPVAYGELIEIFFRQLLNILFVLSHTAGSSPACRSSSPPTSFPERLKHHACLCVCQAASVMSDSATLRAAAHQAPLSVGFSSKNAGVGCHAPIPWIFLPRDRTCVSYDSCFGQQGLYTCATWEVTVKVRWKCKWLRGVWLCHPMDWTVACQAPPSMEFSRQEQWTGLLFPSSGNLPDPGTKPKSPALQADSSPPEPLGKP